MPFLDWLFRATPSESDAPPEVMVIVTINGTQAETRFQPDIPAIAAADEAEAADSPLGLTLVESAAAADLGDAFCLLEYTDASGHPSRRRVSMRSLKESGGRIYLNALCFERSAMRQFRLDRITAMITEDGEVLEPADYFATYGVTLKERTKEQSDALRDAGRALSEIRPGVVILTAVARADRKVDSREIDAAQVYAEREVLALIREGILNVIPSMEMIEAMARDIALMRPMTPMLKSQALRLCDWPTARVERLRRAIQEVVIADNRILQSELDMIADLERLVSESPHERRAEVNIGYDVAEAHMKLRRGLH